MAKKKASQNMVNQLKSSKKTKMKTKEGKTLYKNPDGSHSSERSITVTDQRLNRGMPTNIPSFIGGKQFNAQDSISHAVKSGTSYKSYKTINEAVTAAKARSKQLGKDMQSAARKKKGKK